MKRITPILATALLSLVLFPSMLIATTTNLSKLTTLAQEYEKQGKYEAAIQIYNHIISIDPSQKQLYVTIKLLSEKQNAPLAIGAKTTTTTPSKVSPKTPSMKTTPITNQSKRDDITIAKGYKALEENRLDEAMLHFKQILKRRWKNTLSLYGKAQIHAKRNEWASVEKTLRREARINQAEEIQSLYKLALSHRPYSASKKDIKKTTVAKPSRSKRLQKAEALLANNQLKEAEVILSKLYVENPSNSDVLLRLAETYSKMGEFSKAKEYYQTVLAYSPKNIYALEGLANSHYALKEHKNAIRTYEKIDKKKWNSQLEQNYTLSKLAYLIENKEYEKAQLLGEALFEKNPHNTDTIRQLANLSSLINPDQAIRYRTLAYKQSNQNGDLFALVYALIDANHFSQAENYFNSLKEKKFSTKEKEELKKLYLVYYRKLSSTQLENSKFNLAERTTRSGLLLAPSDAQLNENYGWSLLNLERQDEALKIFETILKKHPSEKIYYAAALSAHKANQNKKSYGYLFKASTTKESPLLEKIAQLYKDMGYQEESLDTIKLIEDYYPQVVIPKQSNPSTSPEAKPLEGTKDFNGLYNPFLSSTVSPTNSYIHVTKEETTALLKNQASFKESTQAQELKKELLAAKQSSLSGGFFFENRSGRSGIDSFSKAIIPVEITLSPTFSHMFKMGINTMYLSSGSLSNQNRTELGYGRNLGGNFNIETLSATEPYASYAYKKNSSELELMLGTTPLNDPIGQSTFVGHIRGKQNIDLLQLSFKALRKPVRETMVSYVGQKDPDNGNVWGRVVRSGFEANLDYAKDWVTALGLGYYPSIKGLNTIENSQMKGTLFVGKNILEDEQERFLLGPLLVFDRYKHSTNHFTYGHGGYFSPTSYSLFSLYGDYTNQLNSQSYFRVKGNAGYSMFQESQEPYLPLNPDNRTYESNSDGGFTMTMKGYAGLKLTSRLHLLGAVGFSIAPQYNEEMGGASLIYYFDDYASSHPSELNRTTYIWDQIQ